MMKQAAVSVSTWQKPILTHEGKKRLGSSGLRASPLPLPHLEVVGGKLQHVPESITDDLRLLLKNHTLIVQRFYDLRLDLQLNVRTWNQSLVGK